MVLKVVVSFRPAKDCLKLHGAVAQGLYHDALGSSVS